VQALAPGITESIASGIVKQDAQSTLDQVTGQLSFPAPKDIAAFLQQIDVSTRGLVLSGYGDSGVLLGFGREQVDLAAGEVVLEAATPNQIYIRFDWTQSSSSLDVTCPVRTALSAAPTAAGFWSASYDELPNESEFGRDALTVAVGQPVWVWVEL